MKIEYRQYDADLFHGFYETELSPWEQLEWWVENDLEDGELKEGETYDIDFEDYKNDIGAQVTDFIMECANKNIITNYKFGYVHSPEYYNFETDQLVIEVNVDMDKLLAWLAEDKDGFNDYLQKNYTSRDGFISYVPNNYDDWLAEIKNDIANNLEFSRNYNVAIDYYLLVCKVGVLSEDNMEFYNNELLDFYCDIANHTASEYMFKTKE